MATGAVADQNDQLAALYKSVGIDPQGIPDTTKAEKPQEKETVLTRTVNIGGQPRTYTGTTEGEILNQVAAAIEAATPAPKPVEKEKPQPKTLSQDELFNIGLELQKGKPEAIEKYLEDSGYLDRALAKHNLSLADVQNAVKVTSNVVSKEQMETAATTWLARAGNDWPGGTGNQKILGLMIPTLGLNPADPESYEKAYSYMKTNSMILPGDKTEMVKKASGSTAFNAHGASEVKESKSDTPTISQAAWSKMKPAEQQAMYNDFVSQGFKPEDIKFVA